MRPLLVSYTDPVTGSQNSTVNDGVNFGNSKVLLNSIITDGRPAWAMGGDGQEPFLTSVISQGTIIELHFYCMQTNVGDGYDILAAMFNKRDTRTKTLIVRDQDDLVLGVGRSYSASCRNIGVTKPRGRSVVARVALVSEVLLVTTATSETAWTNASSAPKVVNIDKGNIEALPVFDLSPNASNTNGNRYREFVTTRNYTRKSAVNYHLPIQINTSALINFTAISVQVNAGAGIAANPAVVTIPYDTVVGTLPAVPFMIYRGGEQMRVTTRTGTTSGNLTVVRAVHGSTITSHADNAVLALSVIAFDGRDVRIFSGIGSGSTVETPYWIGSGSFGMNQTTTLFWIPYTYAARALTTLFTGIDNVVTSMTGTTTAQEGNILPTNGMVIIESEICPYDTYDFSTGIFAGLARGQRGTAAAAHASGVSIYSINELWFYHGNASATAPVYSNQLKPPFDLSQSSATSLVYETFSDTTINTLDEFKPSAGGNNVQFSFGDASGAAPYVQPAPTNPTAFVGVSVIDASSYGQWLLNLPFGYTQAQSTTVKRLSLPANQAFFQAFDGSITTNQAIAAQAASWSGNTTVTLTPTGGTASRFLMLLKNTQTTAYTKRASVQMGSITFTLSNATTSTAWGVPLVSVGALQTLDFDVDTILTNAATGDSIRIVRPDCPVGAVIRIDTLNKTIRFLADNSNAFPALQRYPARAEWLKLLQGNNSLTCSQAGLDIGISWQGRQNSFG
jgi:hypothetical protein